MHDKHKKILRALSLELRHILEGRYDEHGKWLAGDLERRLNQLGVWRDRAAKPLDELPHLSEQDKAARRIVDGYLALRDEASVDRAEAVGEFVRESAYTWANRLFTLRCMEARGIIDEVILQKDAYGGRSLAHHRSVRKSPDAATGEDDGLFAVLFEEFDQRAKELPMLFRSDAPAIALRPSVAALKKCIALLSGREAVRGQEAATDEVFAAPDTLGWAYEDWNSEEKDRIFEMVRTTKGAKIEGADIIPATQLYTEPYMVKFLLQNSLGAMWICMHPESPLCDQWEYYVKDAERAPAVPKPVREITFLDPAMGSGHFHLEAFDLLWSMYEAEGDIAEPRHIAAAILNSNLFGLDIDERSVQIGMAALWMKAKVRAPDLSPADLTEFHQHFVAANIRLPRGSNHIQEFLRKHPEDAPFRDILPAIFHGLANAHELGSLLRVGEFVRSETERMRDTDPLFAISDAPDHLPHRVISRLRDHFELESAAADPTHAFFGTAAGKALLVFDLLAREYDVLAANPPYLGRDKASAILASQLTLYRGGADLYGAFIDRMLELGNPTARLAVLSLATYMHLKDFEDFRQHLLTSCRLSVLAHLSNRTFDSLSNPNAFYFVMTIVEKTVASDTQVKIIELDGTSSGEKEELLARCISGAPDTAERLFRPQQSAFAAIPGSPIAHRLPDWAHRAYTGSRLVSDVADARQGLITGENDRFLRFRWEIYLGARWFRYAKGGAFCRWHGNDEWAVDWQCDGARIRDFRDHDGQLRSRPQNVQYFCRDGATWSSQTISAFGVRRLEPRSIFDVTGSSIFPRDNQCSLEQLMALLNTPAFGELFSAIQPGIHYGEGYLAKLPIPALQDTQHLSDSVKSCIECQRVLRAKCINPSVAYFPAVRRRPLGCGT